MQLTTIGKSGQETNLAETVLSNCNTEDVKIKGLPRQITVSSLPRIIDDFKQELVFMELYRKILHTISNPEIIPNQQIKSMYLLSATMTYFRRTRKSLSQPIWSIQAVKGKYQDSTVYLVPLLTSGLSHNGIYAVMLCTSKDGTLSNLRNAAGCFVNTDHINLALPFESQGHRSLNIETDNYHKTLQAGSSYLKGTNAKKSLILGELLHSSLI